MSSPSRSASPYDVQWAIEETRNVLGDGQVALQVALQTAVDRIAVLENSIQSLRALFDKPPTSRTPATPVTRAQTPLRPSAAASVAASPAGPSGLSTPAAQTSSLATPRVVTPAVSGAAVPLLVAANSTPAAARRSRRAATRTITPITTTSRGRQAVTVPLSTHTPRDHSPDRFLATLVIANNLAGHVVGRGGRGLKQISDISGARLSVFSTNVSGTEERHVSIRGTESQLGDALAVLGKRIARKRVRAPKKKGGDRPLPPAPVPSALSFIEEVDESSMHPTSRTPTPHSHPSSSTLGVRSTPPTVPMPGPSLGSGTPMNSSTPTPTPASPADASMVSPTPIPGSGAYTPMDVSAARVRFAGQGQQTTPRGRQTATRSRGWRSKRGN